ncbi:MAG: tyrosine-type recombinase/integrase [Acidimicrobiia bacterium]
MYLADLAGRAPGAVPTVAADLDDFFAVVARDPLDVTVIDVLDYATPPLRHDRGISRVRNVFRFYAFLVESPDVPLSTNPVPDRLADRRFRRHLPPVVPAEPPEPAGSRWEALGTAGPKLLLDAARTARDRAILAAMLFGALHAGEVVTLRLGDLNPGDGWVVTGGARWPRRIVPLPPAFFAAVDAYLAGERPNDVDTDLLFLAFKGRYRGAPLSTGAIQDIVSRTCTKVGLAPLNAGDLRRACLVALQAAGMGAEALRAFAGRSPAAGQAACTPSPEQLAEEYRRTGPLFAREGIEAGV